MDIVLLTDQSVPANSHLFVCEGGTYEANQLVLVYDCRDPEKTPLVSFSAYFIAHGVNYVEE